MFIHNWQKSTGLLLATNSIFSKETKSPPTRHCFGAPHKERFTLYTSFIILTFCPENGPAHHRFLP